VPVFRILHISDLHFGAQAELVGIPENLRLLLSGQPVEPGVASTHGPRAADALAAFAFDHAGEFDVILLTGDLAATGSTADLQPVQRFLRDPPASGYLTARAQPTLRAAGCPIALLPGNHDRFGRKFLQIFPPGDTRFDTMFSPEWAAGQSAQRLWQHNRQGATVVIIGADFTLYPGDNANHVFGHLGRGRADQPRVDALRTQTARARNDHPDCVVLWAIHFDPEQKGDLLELLEEHRLKSAADAEAIGLILCGHTHQSRFSRFGNAHLAVCGTTSQFHAPPGNQLHVVELDVTPGTPARVNCTIDEFRFSPRRPAAGFLPTTNRATVNW
jgi:3',5'-cyclic AMP phosphodiesterase CpdA